APSDDADVDAIGCGCAIALCPGAACESDCGACGCQKTPPGQGRSWGQPIHCLSPLPRVIVGLEFRRIQSVSLAGIERRGSLALSHRDNTSMGLGLNRSMERLR